ncbi:MAG: DegV family protein [Chloroflexi bacterium]|nr:DegV family protein [Chloroflexota bacterium]
MKIGLVTDSTSDVPASLVEKYQIEVVPAILVVEGQSCADGEGISRREFYSRLPGMSVPPTTASPSAGSFVERYEKMLRAGAEQILSIHASSSLSGIFNAARLAAESFGERVRVLDSGQLSLGSGFQVLSAAEAIARGALLDEILALLESVQARIRVIALLDTLEYLRRSGRVSWAKAMLGGFLDLKPMIELKSGRVEKMGAARTARQGKERLLGLLRETGTLERLAVLHTNAEGRARQLLAELNPALSTEPLIVNVTTAIGAHLGPNGLGFAAVKAE